MSRVLVITDAPKTAALVPFGLALLGAKCDVAASLSEAMARLEENLYVVAVVDLRWGIRGAAALASWIRAHLVHRGIRPVLGAETPLAECLESGFCLSSAVFLRGDFDLFDLREAIGGAAQRVA
ncbi:MAG: hypothetical protein HYY16_17500 [Planctomycetes bacterium]|nr:hypothetical protein [Planctomycetota bacterium]